MKTYIDANKLYEDSFKLAKKIWDSGFRPNFIIGLWRGGTPPGIVIHEFFRMKYKQINLPDPYHTAIKTQSYIGLKSSKDVDVKGMEHVIDIINSEDKILLIDDVFDSGLTIKRVKEIIQEKARKNCPEIRIATVYYKPKNNQTMVEPNYFQEINNNWIVFPHELDGLTKEEIATKSSKIHELLFD